MRLDKKYFVLIFVYLFTVLFVVYISDVYKKTINDNNSSSFNELISSKYKVLYDNVYNYSLEHSSFKIYVGSSFNASDEVLFIDSDKISSGNLNRLISDFGYNYNISKDSVPFYIVFKDGRIKEIVHD